MAIKFDITGDNSQFLDAMKRVQDSVRNTSKAMTDAFDKQASVVIDLTNQMNALADEIERAEKAGDAKSVDEKRKAYEALSVELKEAKELFVEMQQTTTGGGGMDAMGNSSQSLRAKLRELTQTIQQLTLEYRNMSDSEKNSAAGRELQHKIESLTQDAATLSDAMGDVRDSIKNAASDTSNWDALAGGINVATSAIGGLTGAASMLGVEEEKMQEIQTKLQASLAISNALTVIQNNLQKQSALMQKINTIQTKAATAAKAMETKGTVAATIAQKAFNAVAKANPYVLLATAIISVVGALALLSRSNKKAAEEEKELAEIQKRRNEELKKSADLIKNVEGKIAEETVQVKRLRDAIDAENIGSKKRNSLINEFNEKFGSYLSKLLTEKSTALDVANAYAEVVKNLRAKLLLEAREKDFSERVGARYNWEAQRLQEFDEYSRGRATTLTAAKLKEVTDRAYKNAGIGRYGAQGFSGEDVYESVIGYLLQDKLIRWGDTKMKGYIKNYVMQYTSTRVEEQRVKEKWKPYEAEIDAAIEAELNAPISNPTPTRSGGTGSGRGSSWDAAKAAKDRENLFKKWKEELEKTKGDEGSVAYEAYINNMEEGLDKDLKELEMQFLKGVGAINDKKKELIEQARELDLELWKKTAEGNDEYNFVPKTEKEYYDIIEETVPGIFEALDEQGKKLFDNYQKQRNKIIKEEAEAQAAALRDYIKEYGTYEQKRLAIVQETERKIAEAKTAGEKLAAEAQGRTALQALDKEQQKKAENVDWEGIFGDLTLYTADELEDFKQKLRDKLGEEGLEMDEYKTIVEQISKINDAILDDHESELPFWKRAIILGRERKKLEMEIADAEAEQAKARERLENAEKRLDDARLNVALLTDEFVGEEGFDLSKSSGVINKAIEKYGQDSDEVAALIKAIDELTAATDEQTDATDANTNAQKNVETANRKKEKYDKDQKKKLFSDDTQKVLDAVNTNLSALPNLAGALGFDESAKVGQKAASIADMANNAMGAMADFASGNYVGAAFKAINAVGNLGDVIGVGGLSDPELLSDIEKLTATNDALIKAVEELSKDMKDASPAQAMEIYRKQVDMLNQNAKNTQEIMRRSGAAYDSGTWGTGIGGKGSTNKKINKGMTSAEWAQISALVGGNVTGASDFWNLTQEQMHDVAKYAPVLWAKIKGLADDGLQDVSQYMDAYAEGWEAVKNITNQLYEKLTSTTFDGVYDSFKSMMSDMDADAHTFSENFEKYMFDALLSQEMDSKFRDRIERWYNAFATAAEGGLTQRELDDLREGYMGISADIRASRDTIAAIVGLSSGEGSATYNAAKSFTQEQGDILNGRLTAIQMHSAEHSVIGKQIAQSIANMNALVSTSSTAVVEIRNMMIYTNSYLEDIVKYAKATYNDFGEKLENIRYNVETKL